MLSTTIFAIIQLIHGNDRTEGKWWGVVPSVNNINGKNHEADPWCQRSVPWGITWVTFQSQKDIIGRWLDCGITLNYIVDVEQMGTSSD